MYVVVQHRIKDPNVAFARGERLIKNEGAPASVRGLQFYPSRDGSAITCLWEAPSVDAVQHYVDATLGDSSENTYYESTTSKRSRRGPNWRKRRRSTRSTLSVIQERPLKGRSCALRSLGRHYAP
jgi:hypothetical protein